MCILTYTDFTISLGNLVLLIKHQLNMHATSMFVTHEGHNSLKIFDKILLRLCQTCYYLLIS